MESFHITVGGAEILIGLGFLFVAPGPHPNDPEDPEAARAVIADRHRRRRYIGLLLILFGAAQLLPAFIPSR
ncbi:hypothetical protein EAH79_12485 [Sphingomonas koreensis]|nr:hypothetical protein EAH79_12485 [Sphingomonas koreensis]